MTYVSLFLPPLSLFCCFLVWRQNRKLEKANRQLRSALAAATGAKAPAPTTSQPGKPMPLDVAIAMQKMAAGDFVAMSELWERTFGQPVDPTRPVLDIANELGAALSAEYGESA